jgi:hypothetical protein
LLLFFGAPFFFYEIVVPHPFPLHCSHAVAAATVAALWWVGVVLVAVAVARVRVVARVSARTAARARAEARVVVQAVVVARAVAVTVVFAVTVAVAVVVSLAVEVAVVVTIAIPVPPRRRRHQRCAAAKLPPLPTF